ncbi:MAG: creatininase family protein [Rhodothermia bacterium]
MKQRVERVESTPSWGEYARMRPQQIAEVMSATPIAYLPWGAIEWHSYHNPVGLDGFIAEAQCRALARRNGGLVMPVVFAGTDTIKPFKGFKYTFEHSPETVSRLCREYLEQFVDEGFRVVVLVTGHAGGGHTEAISGTVEAFASEHPDVGTVFCASFEPVKDRFPMNHAALGETSLQMVVANDLVDLSLIPELAAPTLDDDGVWGKDPRDASVEHGAAIMSAFVDAVSPMIQEGLSGKA